MKSQKQEFQPKGGFFEALVPPLTPSRLQLSGGVKEPNYYSLGVDSTIPYISLRGGGATQKIFTWGEMIEVAPGQMLTVINESFMEGDIQINSGHDFAAKPERISLPVAISAPFDFGLGITAVRSIFPADTRRCRRAYLKFDIESGNLQVGINFIGKPVKHSFNGVDTATGLRQYQQGYIIPPNTRQGEFPMGYGFNNNILTPMALTDQVEFLVLFDSVDIVSLNTLFMYVMEY